MSDGSRAKLSKEYSTLQRHFEELESKLDQRIGELTAEINGKNQELNEARGSARTAAEKREESMKLLQDRVSAANAKVSDLNKLLANTQSDGKRGAAELSEKLDVAYTLNEELQSKLGTLFESTKKLERELEVMKNNMLRMNDNLDEARNAEKNARAETRGLTGELHEARRGMEDEASKMAKKLAKLSEDLSRSRKVSQGLEKEVERLGGQMEQEVVKTKDLEDERDELRAKVKAFEENVKSSTLTLKESPGSKGDKAQLKELRTILAGKDDEITNLQATVHRECMERTAILERLKELQAKTSTGSAKVAPSRSAMSPTAPEFTPKTFNPTTPPKGDDEAGGGADARASQQWTSGSGGRGGRGRGRGGRNRGRRKGGTMVDG